MADAQSRMMTDDELRDKVADLLLNNGLRSVRVTARDQADALVPLIREREAAARCEGAAEVRARVKAVLPNPFAAPQFRDMAAIRAALPDPSEDA